MKRGLFALLAVGIIGLSSLVVGCSANKGELIKPAKRTLASESKLIREDYRKIAEELESQGNYVGAMNIYYELGDTRNAERVFYEVVRRHP